MNAWLAVVVALAAAWLAIALRLRFAHAGLDVPGHRSLHARPVPHGGGLGIVAAGLCGGALLGLESMWWTAVAVLAALSLIDDWRPLPFWLRLPVHLGVAAGVLLSAGEPVGFGLLALVLALGWTTNAYNFMDGADGLAGTMAVVGFGCYAAAFVLAGLDRLGLFCLIVALAALVFLRFNWHPARIFMGDVGSIPLGFLVGALGWFGVERGVWPWAFPLLVFAPFLGDATRTLLRRAWRGERVWEAHREHVYQRQVRLGLSPRDLCLRWGAIMLCGGGLALATLSAAPAWAGGILCAWLVVLAGLARRVDGAWNKQQERVEAE